jgi:hypothetical protein
VQLEESVAQCMPHNGCNKLLLPLQDMYIGMHPTAFPLALKMVTALLAETVQ